MCYMGKEDSQHLLQFLQPFPMEIRDRALWLRNWVWEQYPGTNELIYDNYNALAFGWSPTDRVGHVFCSMALGRSSHNLHFGFYWGAELSDPEKRLLGKGNQYRYLLVQELASFPLEYVKKLVREAFANSLAKVKDPKSILHGKTITKSVSAKRRPLANRLQSGQNKKAPAKKTVRSSSKKKRLAQP